MISVFFLFFLSVLIAFFLVFFLTPFSAFFFLLNYSKSCLFLVSLSDKSLISLSSFETFKDLH